MKSSILQRYGIWAFMAFFLATVVPLTIFVPEKASADIIGDAREQERKYQYGKMIGRCIGPSANGIHTEDLSMLGSPSDWMIGERLFPGAENIYVLTDKQQHWCGDILPGALDAFGYSSSDYSEFLRDLKYTCTGGNTNTCSLINERQQDIPAFYQNILKAKKIPTQQTDAMKYVYSLDGMKAYCALTQLSNPTNAEKTAAQNNREGYTTITQLATDKATPYGLIPVEEVYYKFTSSLDCPNGGNLADILRQTSKSIADSSAKEYEQKVKTLYTSALSAEYLAKCAPDGAPQVAIDTCEANFSAKFATCWNDAVFDMGQYASTSNATPNLFPSSLAACLEIALGAPKDSLLNAAIAAANSATNLAGTYSSNPAATSNIDDNCPLEPGTTMRWLGCSIFESLKGTADKLTVLLNTFLYTPTAIFDEPAAKNAATTFRNIGMALVVIAGLVMVISQISGSQLVDAYTIRKLLPRMLIVLFGMAIAWPALRLVVSLTNDLGALAHSVFLQLAGDVGARGNVSGGGESAGVMLGVLLGGGAALLALGFLGFLSLIGTVVLALLVALFVLSIRQLVVLMCVVMAPLALAAYILPGTQKLWSFWKNTFLTTLFMYPLIMGFIGAGKAMSYLLGATKAGQTENNIQILTIIVYFAPYFMLPFAFKMAGGLMSTIFSLANDKNRGLFDRLKKGRGERMNKNLQAMKTGNRFRDTNRAGAIFNRATKRAYDETQTFGLTRDARARRREAYHANHGFHEAQQIRKEHGDMMVDDTINNAILQSDGSLSDIRGRLQAQKDAGEWHGDVQAAVGTAERLLHTGSRQSVMAAIAMHQVSTGSGFKNQQHMLDTVAKASGGNTELATKMLGTMRGEAKQVGRSDLVARFGSQNAALMNMMHDNRTLTAEEAADLSLSSFSQTDVATIARDRHESVRAHTSAMAARIRELRDGPADRMITMDDDSQIRADDLADSLTAQLQNLTDSTREYGALDRAHVAHGTTSGTGDTGIADTYVPPDFIGPTLPNQPRLGDEHSAHRSRWAGDQRSLNDPNRRPGEPPPPAPEE